MRFPKFGFRRNTHTKGTDELGRIGPFNVDCNVWQVHTWNRSLGKEIGSHIDSQLAISFEEIAEKCPNIDEETIALTIVELIQCGLVVVEKINDYETNIYDNQEKFWEK